MKGIDTDNTDYNGLKQIEYNFFADRIYRIDWMWAE
jgi:hypothetical protein